MLKRKFLSLNVEEVFRKYERETHHKFPRDELEKAVREVVEWRRRSLKSGES